MLTLLRGRQRSFFLLPLWHSRCNYGKLIFNYVAIKTVKTPYMADSITQGTLSSWEKQIGDSVHQDDLVANIETDKVTIPVNSPYEGILSEQLAKEGDTVTVGGDLFKIDVKPVEGKPKESTTKEDTKEPLTKIVSKGNEATKETNPKIKFILTPPVKQTPNEETIDKEQNVTQSTQPQIHNRREKMSRMRLRIAERLKEAQNQAASLTTFNEVDLQALSDLRVKYKDAFLKKHGVKLGFMSPFMMAVTRALQEIPVVNASVEINNQEIIYHKNVDISVAVSTPKGLVTPVVRNCQNMSLADMERTLAELGEKARDGKISMDDLTGGTFTISNGGVFGSMMGTPIINIPQVAILGMHAIKDRPMAVNGQVVIRPHMYLALTYDHRIIDGREAVTFLVRIKELIEDPHRFLLDL